MTRPHYGSWSMPGPNGSTTQVTPLSTRGPKRLWNAPAGFVVRERGDVDGLVTLEYLCPVHGRFEARVGRRETPDEIVCPRGWPSDYCGRLSPWSPSTFSAWRPAGEVKS